MKNSLKPTDEYRYLPPNNASKKVFASSEEDWAALLLLEVAVLPELPETELLLVRELLLLPDDFEAV